MDSKKKYLSIQEMNTIYNSFNTERQRLIHKVLQWTGRRITEALNLKPKDIAHEKKKIHFIQLKKRQKIGEDEEGKSIFERKNVTIPVDCDAFYDDLMQYIEKNEIKPDEFVFFSPYKGRDHHLTRRRVEQIYMKAGLENGINVIPHFMRHSFAIALLDYYITVKKMSSLDACVKVMSLLGHSDINTTIRYLLFIEKDSGLKDMYSTGKIIPEE